MADGRTSHLGGHRAPRGARSRIPVLVAGLVLVSGLVLTSAVLRLPALTGREAVASAVPVHQTPSRDSTVLGGTPSIPTRDATGTPTGDATVTKTSGATGPGHPPTRSPWAIVLRDLGDRRATAWRLGRPELLDRVYLPGSAALVRDRSTLEGYLHRGLRVVGARLVVESVRVLGRSDTSARLLVVDRLGPTVAVDATGQHQPLPNDQPTRHRIELRRVGDQWRIAGIAAL